MVTSFQNSIGDRAQFGRIGGVEAQRDRQHDPILAALENALAVVEFTRCTIDFARRDAIEIADANDALIERMAIGAGVAVDRAAQPAGDTGHGFEAAQAGRDRRVNQILEHGSRGDGHRPGANIERGIGVAQNDAGETAVGGHQIGAATDDGVGFSGLLNDADGLGQGALCGGIGQDTRGAAHGKASIAVERGIFENRQAGDGGQPGNHAVYLEVFENSPSSPDSDEALGFDFCALPPRRSTSWAMLLPRTLAVGMGLPSIRDFCTPS